MAQQKKRCMRCRGKKKIYKIRNGYSHANTGGVLVDCPMCLGDGRILKLEDALKKVDELKPETKKEISNGKRKSEKEKKAI